MDYRLHIRKKKASRKAVARNGVKVLLANEKNEPYFIGDLKLGTCKTTLPENISNIQAKVEHEESNDFLILTHETGQEAVQLSTEYVFIKGIFSNPKIFSSKFKQIDEEVNLLVYFTKLPVEPTSVLSRLLVRDLFKIKFNVGRHPDCGALYIMECTPKDTDEHKKKSVDSWCNVMDVYRIIRERQLLKLPSEEFVPSKFLKSHLRPYQKQAVVWMLEKEKRAKVQTMHPCFQSLTLPSGLKVFYNQFNGTVLTEEPLEYFENVGGILADEMGLGKTVEVLACILNDISEDSKEESKVQVSRQRKRPAMDEVVELHHVQESPKSKNIKLGNVEVAKKNKSPLKAMLMEWYEEKLVSVNTPKKQEEIYVLCICGCSKVKEDIVQCVDCQKRQHAKCMGYKKQFGEYRCPQCWKLQPLLESNATLIICPQSLQQQWVNEISKHVECNLNILVYDGCTSLTPIYPVRLQKLDIVITTYTVLKNELKYAESSEPQRARKHQKYSIPGSPMTLIHWKRLYVDEAQLIKSTTTMIAEMTARLSADHRWAVTGTPVSTSLADIYGLISYLQMSPYDNQIVFNNCLYEPFTRNDKEPFLEFLSNTLWRTQIADVLDQINIPGKETVMHPVEFNQIERYYYNKESEMNRGVFLRKIDGYDPLCPLASIQQNQLTKLLMPIMALRKACVHHKTVQGKYINTKNSVNSMQDLLNALIAKNITESEEFLRIVISSLNGLAGISLLLQNCAGALEHYRTIRNLEKKFASDDSAIKLHIDTLLLIHMYHNSTEIITLHPDIQKTEDETVEGLKNKGDLLEFKYLNRADHLIKQNLEPLNEYTKLVDKFDEEFSSSDHCWYSDIVTDLFAFGMTDLFAKRISNVVANNEIKTSVFSRDETELVFRLQEWERNLRLLREESMESVNDLYDIFNGQHIIISQELVSQAVDCHLRPNPEQAAVQKKCPLCESHGILAKYENSLFDELKRKEKQNSWKACEEELILSIILSLGKSKLQLTEEIVEEGQAYIKRLDILKKEFKSLRKVWTLLDAQICAFDEIRMCKSRLRFKSPETASADSDKNRRVLQALSYELENRVVNEISQFELDYHRVNLEAEGMQARKQLERTLGIHNYLKSLHDNENSDQPRDPCPICRNPLTTNWNILKCGHCYCVICLQELISETNEKRYNCAVCRERFNKNDINYINTSGVEEKQTDMIINGYCSSKVEQIITLVQSLIKEDPGVKILIFSTWLDVLKLIHNICGANEIESEVLLAASEVVKKVGNFKDKKKNISVLLVQVHLGGVGLNLTEASHVIFAEPLLDPSDESQAIGRVHRIGQKKPVTVHKFVVHDSIEEKIYQVSVSNDSQKWYRSEVTVQQIKELINC